MTRIKLKSLGQEAIATGLSNGLMLSVEGRVGPAVRDLHHRRQIWFRKSSKWWHVNRSQTCVGI